MTALHERAYGFVRVGDQCGDRKIGGRSGLLAVSQAVHHRHEQAVGVRLHEVPVSRLGLSWHRRTGDSPFDRRGIHRFHFLIVTVVSVFAFETR